MKVNHLIKVDPEFEYLLDKYIWHVGKDPYPRSWFYIGDNRFPIWLHKMIIPCERELVLDHINNNPLDNRSSNLRTVTRQQNNWNQTLSKNNTSGFKGVSRSKLRFKAELTYNQERVYLGLFKTPEEAHLVYCFASQFYFGEYANPGY